MVLQKFKIHPFTMETFYSLGPHPWLFICFLFLGFLMAPCDKYYFKVGDIKSSLRFNNLLSEVSPDINNLIEKTLKIRK